MSYFRLGPVAVCTSNPLRASGCPVLHIGGLQIWSWSNTGDFIPFGYHPRDSITWRWSVWIGRRRKGEKRYHRRYNCGGQGQFVVPFFRVFYAWQDRMPRR